MKIGIYGGTFNPPHLGHLAAARTAVDVLGLDRLYLIPTRQPPHKELPCGSPTAEQRFAMTAIAADQLGLGERVEVLDTELRREGDSYTADTLEELHRKHPEDELYLLMGTDMFLTLQTWHQPERVTRLATICAFGRTEQDTEEVFAPQREFLKQRYHAKVITITLPDLVDISSTRLRGMLAKGEGRSFLAPAVYGYILRERLYATNADLSRLDFPELRAVSYSMIRAKRIPHVQGCEETAVRLAAIWGEREDDARAAAILHDCTKYLDLREQLNLCEKYGIVLDDLEQTAVKLLHSKTGAALAKHLFGQSKKVSDAICWHTTGKADMTTLEKILYIADYMEPTRDFPGVEELRALVEHDLDGAVMLGLKMSIEEVSEKGYQVHPNTLEAYQWLKGREGL